MASEPAAVVRVLTGRYRAVRPRVGNGPGQPPAEDVETVIRFAFRAPSLWRHEFGGRVAVAESNFPPWVEPGLSFPGEGWPWRFAPDPARLVVPALPELPAGRPAEHDGRAAVRTEMAGPEGVTLQLVIDGRTGMVLRASAPGTAYVEELSELAFPEALPDDRFVQPDDDGSADRAELLRWERIREHYRVRPLPVPASWPGPIGRPSPIGGDPDTGFVVVDLDTEPSLGTPTAAQLVRQPLEEPPYFAGWARDPGHHLQRWRDDRWQWTLVLSDNPLTVEQLERVRRELADAE
ncbi:hypothetical protein ACFVXG_08400 [Kitasatospora sp. NPDC058162]|uniref:hypothetical protein n=1 Tax=Kitasatospora sp. NPDC058162 TaxID=3346362 RepID=UPI0036DE8FCC